MPGIGGVDLDEQLSGPVASLFTHPFFHPRLSLQCEIQAWHSSQGSQVWIHELSLSQMRDIKEGKLEKLAQASVSFFELLLFLMLSHG